MDSSQVLSDFFGFSSFRPNQKEIIDSVDSGADTFALLPTGGGKSLCYQVPALMKEGLTLVISPLISLMLDQEEALKLRGINAIAIHAGLKYRQVENALDNCAYGNVKILYCSPERLLSPVFQERLEQFNINLIAVDEAHCISEWGHDFRPSYLHIKALRDKFPEVPMLALTATATPKVENEIIELLGLNSPKIHKASFERTNLSLSVRWTEDKEQKLVEILQNVPGSAIIYVRSRRKARELSQWLVLQHDISSTYYHAGLSSESRNERQRMWKEGRNRVIVATNAFGMGIDKHDVRLVVHYDVPPSLESYYQEAGRAGRDGKLAYAVLLVHNLDENRLTERFNIAHPGRKYLKHVYQCLANFYQLATGSGLGESYELDLAEFSKRYELNSLEAYQALKRLGEEELLSLSESIRVSTTLKIILGTQQLYEFQVANAVYDSFLKGLLRLYGGQLYSDFMRIEELKIASFLNLRLEQVVDTLTKLDELEIVSYNPLTDKPQVIFLKERQDANTLVLNKKRLNALKESDRERLESVIGFSSQNTECRMKFVLSYFGEEGTDCGKCDVCLDKKHEEVNVTDMVLAELEDSEITLKELITRLAIDDQRLKKAVKELLDSNQIIKDEEVLHLRKMK